MKHVVPLQETVQRAERHSRHHDEQRTRPSSIQQRVDERPEGTENMRGDVTRRDYSSKRSPGHVRVVPDYRLKQLQKALCMRNKGV